MLLTTFSLPAQFLTSVSPDSAYRTQSLAVTISGQGTHFIQGSGLTQVWLNQGSVTLYPQFNIIQSSTLLDAHFTIPQTANLGLWDVNVWTQTDGQMIRQNDFLIYDLSGVGIPKPIQDALESLVIYPNPLQPDSKVKFTLGQSGQVSLAFFDVQGRQLTHPQTKTLAPGAYEWDLDLPVLSKGTYLLKFAIDQRVMVKRVAVQ